MSMQKLREPKPYYDPEMDVRPAEAGRSGRSTFWYFRNGALIISCVIVILLCYQYYKSKHTPDEPSWDFLLFTQLYPITCCIWNEIENRGECHFSPNPHTWTVHGIWPTKNNTEGPLYCNNIKFNKTVLEPIIPELQNRWPSIDSPDATQFWKHEWRKHGTCAILDKAFFDSELTYFKLGLDWNGHYNVTNILNAAGIVPSNQKSYERKQFHDAIKSALGKAPQLDCYHYKPLDVYLVHEIRLCFSRDLKLLDCDSLYTDDDINCPSQVVMYPDNLSFNRS